MTDAWDDDADEPIDLALTPLAFAVALVDDARSDD